MSQLADKLRAARESWVEVEPGKRFCVRRPAETRMPQFRYIDVDKAVSCCVRWEGITEADLLGASVGASDPAPFDADACTEVLSDRSEWHAKVSEAIVNAMQQHLDAKERAAKN